jgi:hypothetical protein
MYTMNENNNIDAMLESGHAPWAPWERNRGRVGAEPIRTTD